MVTKDKHSKEQETTENRPQEEEQIIKEKDTKRSIRARFPRAEHEVTAAKRNGKSFEASRDCEGTFTKGVYNKAKNNHFHPTYPRI